MKRLAWHAGLAALTLAFAATAVQADDTVINGKKSFLQSLFGDNSSSSQASKKKLLLKQHRRTIFDSPWWTQRDPGQIRIINGQNPTAADIRNQNIGDNSDPEGISGYGMGNLTYVPGKLVALGGTAPKAERPAEPLAAAIFDALANPDLGIKVRAGERDAILAHYAGTGFRPLWTADGKLSPRAAAVLKLFAAAADDGLEPGNYLPPGLAGYAAAAEIPAGDLAGLARLDLGLTAMALKYAREASGGEFDPGRLSLYNDVSPEAVAPATALRVIAWSPYAGDYLQSLEPKHPAYAAMKAALAKLRKEEQQTAPAIKLVGGPRVKPGKNDPRIASLRERLKQLGYPLEAAADTTLLDPALSGVLKQYQKEAGIKATGNFDQPTVTALNGTGTENEKLKLIDNMERLRWLPKSLGNRYVLVNQAAFRVQVMDRGKEVWTSKVIVGKPMTQTAVFDDQIETVVFNPSWGVPPSIVANEYLPKLRDDPSYLDSIGFRVVDSSGRQVSSGDVDWWSYGNKVPYSIQQPPGRKNALGELKFLFPNQHNIYMHDTPSRELFANDVRAFSHGCVRVQNPREFATVLLGWDRAKIDKMTDSKVSQSVALPVKVPVHLTYFTAWPDETGKIQYFKDIYGRDQAMDNARSALLVAQK